MVDIVQLPDELLRRMSPTERAELLEIMEAQVSLIDRKIALLQKAASRSTTYPTESRPCSHRSYEPKNSQERRRSLYWRS
jgi:hypothetical protein